MYKNRASIQSLLDSVKHGHLAVITTHQEYLDHTRSAFIDPIKCEEYNPEYRSDQNLQQVTQQL